MRCTVCFGIGRAGGISIFAHDAFLGFVALVGAIFAVVAAVIGISIRIAADTGISAFGACLGDVSRTSGGGAAVTCVWTCHFTIISLVDGACVVGACPCLKTAVGADVGFGAIINAFIVGRCTGFAVFLFGLRCTCHVAVVAGNAFVCAGAAARARNLVLAGGFVADPGIAVAGANAFGFVVCACFRNITGARRIADDTASDETVFACDAGFIGGAVQSIGRIITAVAAQPAIAVAATQSLVFAFVACFGDIVGAFGSTSVAACDLAVCILGAGFRT